MKEVCNTIPYQIFITFLLGNYTFAALHPVDTISPINQGSFSLLGMKTNPSTITVTGNPPEIQVIGKASLINLGVVALTDITYNIIGLDSILTSIDIDHPTSLQPGK
jgi:hypothetical protein